ncbi:site-specific integrase [Bacteroides fragilis]|nr:site-specific integrase [Bacteroides fragilis]MCE8655363.1 site-specific integrase [Bacteroides fragilis]
MSKQTFCILFLVKTSKALKTGEVTLQLRLTINGQRKDIYLPRRVNPKLWNQKKERMNGKDVLCTEINKYIDSVRARIYEIQRKLEDEGSPINVNVVKEIFCGEKSPSNNCHMFFEEFQAEIDRMESLIGIDYAKITVGRYKLCLQYIKEMYAGESKQADIAMKDVNNAMIKRYDTFLKTQKGLCQNTVTRYMKCFRKIINKGLDNAWIIVNPFANIKSVEVLVDKATLTPNEIIKIYKKEFEIERLQVCRDVFIFCCFTGLAFIDVFNLRPEHVVSDSEGNLWIQKKREKTDIEANIPLTDIPLSILKKYEEHPKCLKMGRLLPCTCNQKMNSYIKEIADFCGIQKELTTHTGRRTFATLMAGDGTPLKNLAKMMGHTNTRMTERYVKPQTEAMLRDVKEMTSRFANI